MTTQIKSGRENRFVQSKLPWVIAAVALVFYVATINRGISLLNIDTVARSAGWMWGPELYHPLYFLLTLPLRWLPQTLVGPATNLFSVGCAVLTLWFLARSVTLLPHDRTEDQRQRERSKSALLSIRLAWIPPVLAAIVCGLQLNFWEGATSGSSEMLDVLLVAYIVYCLLEVRISQNDSQIMRAALVCGLGMANNWIMCCLFPAFVISVIWIKRLEFFRKSFLLRFFLCGVAGMMLYLLLPTIHVFSSDPLVGFWKALKVNLALDKSAIMVFTTQLRPYTRMMLVLTSFLPVIIIGIRWASNFGDPSRMGGALATWIFHLAHGVLLAACIWVAFDPVFSPRHLHYPILALYFLAALSAGYFSGYFLLVFKPLPDRMGRTYPLQRWLHATSNAAIVALLVVVPVGLIYRNLPEERMTGGYELKRYAALLASNLPERAVLLSDDSRKLFLAESWLASQHRSQNYVFLDTHLLPLPSYHAFLRKRRPQEWQFTVNTKVTNQIDAFSLIGMMDALSKRGPVVYLHPSFGYYFEMFDSRPHGLAIEMRTYPTNSISGPPVTPQEIAENEALWNLVQPVRQTLAPFIAQPVSTNKPSFDQKLTKRLQIPYEPNSTAVVLGGFYSISANNWGVKLQRAGKLEEAERQFQTALDLNPDNLAAKSNLDANRSLRAGKRLQVRLPESIDEELGRYRSWEQALQLTGLFDDPTHCFGLGIIFGQGRLLRQAGQQFERAHELAPDHALTQLWLAGIYTRFRLPEKALDLIANLRRNNEATEAAGIGKKELLPVEASALFAANRIPEAEQLLENYIQSDPHNTNVLATVIQIAATFRHYTNAISAIDRLIEVQPDNIAALMSKGSFALQMTNYVSAIDALTRVLTLETNNYNARLYRALAYLGSDQLDEATQDYKELETLFPKSADVASGLAEISWRRKDTNAAIHYYSLSLSNAPPNVRPERLDQLKERLKALQPEKP